MKMNKISLIFFVGLLLMFTSCDLDYFPSDAMTPDQLKSDPGGALYATDGNYAMFKDRLAYRGESSGYSGNSYVRHYFQMAEFPSDNITLAGRTSDPLYEATTYKRDAALRNVTYMWWVAYRIINGANSVIESVQDGVSVESDHLKGENYFIRAIAHLNLSTLYSRPYSHGRENLGVVLRTSTDAVETSRATVGEVYDQIEADLLDAIRLMDKGTRRGNAGYASKAAAQGLLSRVYLYMEKNEEVIKVVDEMLAGADPMSKLETTQNLPNYFANALTSHETLWAVAHTEIESRGTSSIASMYLSDGVGWGEVYSSDPLNDLYEKYPNDVRYSSFIWPQYVPDSDKYMVRWPVKSAADDFYENAIQNVTFDSSQQKFFFKDSDINNGNAVWIEEEIVNGHTQNYIMLGGSKQRVRLTREMYERASWPKYFVKKFSYQDDNPMLSSPVMLRWGEVILNRAEAYAKTNKRDAAIADVNVLRARAGLSGNELFSTSNMMGYTDILDVVLDERRLELSFEGHRMHDLYRNKKSMDRRFAGAQPWEIINYDNNKIVYFIPLDEITVSNITQNP